MKKNQWAYRITSKKDPQWAKARNVRRNERKAYTKAYKTANKLGA